MNEALAAFLGRLDPPKVGEVMWGGNTQLEVSSYIHSDPPPLALVTSIRAVVTDRPLESDNQLLFLDAALDALGPRP